LAPNQVVGTQPPERSLIRGLFEQANNNQHQLTHCLSPSHTSQGNHKIRTPKTPLRYTPLRLCPLTQQHNCPSITHLSPLSAAFFIKEKKKKKKKRADSWQQSRACRVYRVLQGFADRTWYKYRRQPLSIPPFTHANSPIESFLINIKTFIYFFYLFL